MLMLKTTISGLFAAAALAATPAFAAEQPAAGTTQLAAVSAGQTPDAPTRARAKAADEGKICIKEDFTGSRVRKTICRTKAQWNDQGVEVQ